MVAAVVTTLSAGDLMAYIDCGGPPEDIIRIVKARLKERDLNGMLDEFKITIPYFNTSSSDEETIPSSTTTSFSAMIMRRSEIVI
ncbi:hypothetical protein R6Q59_018955 [Mikania micrantha]